MRVHVIPGDADWANLGDVAMAQVAVRRLMGLWPSAVISVTTSRDDLLARHCPGTMPVPADGQTRWFSDRSVFGGRIYPGLVPPSLQAWAGRIEASARHRWPRRAYQAVALAQRARILQSSTVTSFGRALFESDMLVVSGTGDLNSALERPALRLLAMIRAAHVSGLLTFLFGQGIGPIDTATLWARAKAVLPQVDLIAVREKRKGPGLLEEIGADKQRVIFTGDDAVELAYDARVPSPGGCIGVNIRFASYSAIDEEVLGVLRPVLHAAAQRYDARLLPVPIRIAGADSDIPVIRRLILGAEDQAAGWDALGEPLDIIHQVARCRLVITTSYHAAVFALAQGIPAIALIKSAYYADKFLGLADAFAGGCECIDLSDTGFPEHLNTAIDRTWRNTAGLRAPLLDAAARQIELSRSAYRRAFVLAGDRPGIPRDRTPQTSTVPGW